METMEIPVQAPFDFPRMLRRLASHGKSPITRVDPESHSLKRMVYFKEKPVFLHVSFAGTPDHPRLFLHLADPMEPGEKRDFVRWVQAILSADQDLSAFYNRFQDHPQLSPLMARYRGLRILREPDLFETMVKTIISQQLNLSFAGTLIQRLVELAGETCERGGETYLLFPKPETVANLTYAQLREISFSQRKAEYVIDFAREVADGKLDLEQLRTMPDEEVMERLIRIRGVGKWTIECFLLFGMGRPDLLPAADIGLRNAIRKIWRLPHQPTEAEVRAIAADWSPWSSYVTYYLWESLSDA